jgi:hypothetical protein
MVVGVDKSRVIFPHSKFQPDQEFSVVNGEDKLDFTVKSVSPLEGNKYIIFISSKKGEDRIFWINGCFTLGQPDGPKITIH